MRLLGADPGSDQVELVGSRARGDALPQSDWDFKITTGAFVEVPATPARVTLYIRDVQPVTSPASRRGRTHGNTSWALFSVGCLPELPPA